MKNPAKPGQPGGVLSFRLPLITYRRLRRQPTKPSDNTPRAERPKVEGSGTAAVAVSIPDIA